MTSWNKIYPLSFLILLFAASCSVQQPASVADDMYHRPSNDPKPAINPSSSTGMKYQSPDDKEYSANPHAEDAYRNNKNLPSGNYSANPNYSTIHDPYYDEFYYSRRINRFHHTHNYHYNYYDPFFYSPFRYPVYNRGGFYMSYGLTGPYGMFFHTSPAQWRCISSGYYGYPYNPYMPYYSPYAYNPYYPSPYYNSFNNAYYNGYYQGYYTGINQGGSSFGSGGGGGITAPVTNRYYAPRSNISNNLPNQNTGTNNRGRVNREPGNTGTNANQETNPPINTPVINRTGNPSETQPSVNPPVNNNTRVVSPPDRTPERIPERVNEPRQVERPSEVTPVPAPENPHVRPAPTRTNPTYTRPSTPPARTQPQPPPLREEIIHTPPPARQDIQERRQAPRQTTRPSNPPSRQPQPAQVAPQQPVQQTPAPSRSNDRRGNSQAPARR